MARASMKAQGVDVRLCIEDVLKVNCKRKAKESAFIDYDDGGKCGKF
jgi:hypothetical protein